jgi:hypothetical protein
MIRLAFSIAFAALVGFVLQVVFARLDEVTGAVARAPAVTA